VVLDPNVNPNGVLAEAMYFGVQSMVDAIRHMQDEATGTSDKAELTRGDLVRLIASAGLHSRLRLQGVNLSGLGMLMQATNQQCT
jgi:BTB/POZ domain-containing protein KCTD9